MALGAITLFFVVVAFLIARLRNARLSSITAAMNDLAKKPSTGVVSMAEISTQISGVQSAAHEVVEAIELISKTMDEVGSATNEISHNVQHAASGTRDVAENMATVTTSLDEVIASSDTLSASNEVAHQTENLEQTVANFLTEAKVA